MKLTVDRVVVRGLATEPDPAQLQVRVANELRSALRNVDTRAIRDPAAVVAAAVQRAAGAGHG